MSSVTYGNGNVPSNDDPSSGAIIQHPYLASNAYTAAAVVASPSSLGPYQHYYGHPLPQQQLIHAQQPASFYPPTTLNHLQQHGDFSNSSSSVASSSSSIESSRKTGNRKRSTDKTTISNKSGVKRKAVCFHFFFSNLSLKKYLWIFSPIRMKMILMTMMMRRINVTYVVLPYRM
jgi:hypothetical protein